MSNAASDTTVPLMAQHTNANIRDGRKRVLVVGAGAAGMSAAHHLSQHPDKFNITLIDAVDHCGGQAFSIAIDKDRHGASWCNQGVQGGSYIFHHTATMFARQGYHADHCNLHVSFGKDDTFWTNVFPTRLLARHARQVRRLAGALKLMRWLEPFLALLPLRLVLKMFLFSDHFINTIALPMTALFLGTGNATPDVPAIMFERLCTSPTYGMWYPADKNSVVANKPPMIVFPNLSDFYESWKNDLLSRGVAVRLSTELAQVVGRDEHGVVVKLKPRTAMPDRHNRIDDDDDVETYDELVLCCLADTAKRLLGRTASWRENKVLGSARFSDDMTITHHDSDYMTKHYENFYRHDLAVSTLNGTDQSSRLASARRDFRPMYYIKTYAPGRHQSKLEMCFDCTNYQSQFPGNVPFEHHVFQTIYLNKDRDSELWTDHEIDAAKVIRRDWWHQLCHTYTHYLLVVPWLMFLNAKKHTRFAGSWTLVNAHEIAILSGIAAAVDLGATYPQDLENDNFAFLCFRLYYLVAYGKWYRRHFTATTHVQQEGAESDAAAREGKSWATGLYGSVYKGPGVSETEKEKCSRAR